MPIFFSHILYRYALLYGRFIVGTLSQIAASLHCSKYLPSTIASESNDAPQKSKDLFSKGKIYMEAPLSRGGGQGGEGELKQQFVQTSHFSLGPAANRSPLDGQRICQRVCLHLPQPTTHPHSPFHFSIIVCGKKANSWATTINNTISTTHPAAAPLSPPPPGRCWTWPGSTSCSPPPTSASTLPSSPPQTWQSARHLLDLDPHTCKRESLIMLIIAVVMFCM